MSKYPARWTRLDQSRRHEDARAILTGIAGGVVGLFTAIGIIEMLRGIVS